MGNFNRDRGYGGGRDRDRGGRGGGGGFGRRDNDRPMMHEARCAECGRTCEVPFRPTGDKPVYCKDCFDRRGGRDDRGGDDRRRDQAFGGNRNSWERDERSDKPRAEKPASPELLDQIKSMNAKLDRLLRALEIRGEKTDKAIKLDFSTDVAEEKPAKKVAKKAKKEKAEAAPKKVAKKATKKAK